MPEETPEPIEKILRRAEELPKAPEPSVDAAELLAAFRDGALTASEVDEEALKICIQTFGANGVANALLEGAKHRALHESPFSRENLERAPAMGQIAPFPVAPQRGANAIKRWRVLPRWFGMAVAAAVLIGLYSKFTLVKPTWRETFDTAANWPADRRVASTQVDSALRQRALPKTLPSFSNNTSTLGTTNAAHLDWKKATVIIKSDYGWGSGAVISSDGWILTSYDVVAEAAQAASLNGTPAEFELILAEASDGIVRPASPRRAKLHRADARRDLALLKLSGDEKTVPRSDAYFLLSSGVEPGRGAFLVGADAKLNLAWAIWSGTISRVINVPQMNISLPALASATAWPRPRVKVIVADIQANSGLSGAPLLDQEGKLAGITYLDSPNKPKNDDAETVSTHIAVDEIRTLVANKLPAAPEGVPFDLWTAGLPQAIALDAERVDLGKDGTVESLRIRYGTRDPDTSAVVSPVATSYFVSIAERSKVPTSETNVPSGLWGLEDIGTFTFDLALSLRTDGVIAIGYVNRQGIVDEIRLGHSGDVSAQLIWRRNDSGLWNAAATNHPTPLISFDRFDRAQATILKKILQAIRHEHLTANIK